MTSEMQNNADGVKVTPEVQKNADGVKLTPEVQEPLNALMLALRQTPECAEYWRTRDKARDVPGLLAKMRECRRMEMQYDGLQAAGKKDGELEEALTRLQRELGFVKAALEFYQAEYALHAQMATVVCELSRALGMDTAFADV